MALYLSVLPRCSSSVKLRGLLKAFVLGAVLCGCGDTPEAGLEELIAASNEGAVEKLFPRLTERSIPLVQTAAMVGGEEGPLAFSRSSVPVEILSLTPQGGTSVMVKKTERGTCRHSPVTVDHFLGFAGTTSSHGSEDRRPGSVLFS